MWLRSNNPDVIAVHWYQDMTVVRCLAVAARSVTIISITLTHSQSLPAGLPKAGGLDDLWGKKKNVWSKFENQVVNL